ncbi:MAG: efflux RND transporter periplasmic adaptor subunit [Pirellulaceae bacterium]|nr:efflux RND transporter periplasmic adaptor subunit [Pirellulaceae bacterium]
MSAHSAIEIKRRSPGMAVFLSSMGVVAAVVLVGCGLVGLRYWQSTHMAQHGPPPEMPTAVVLAEATASSFRPTSAAIGTVVAPRSIVLSNEISGTVAQVQLSPGTVVEPGTVLVELDNSVEAAQLESAVAAAKMAQSRFNRTKQAQRNRAMTELELEEAEGQLAQAEARVAELKAIIERKRLVAPFRARVGLSNTHPGQYLPSGTEITSLQSVEGYYFIDFALPQHVAGSVEVGQRVQLLANRQNYTAKIEALDSRSDRLTRNLLARARLDDAPTDLKPGDSVQVQIEYGAECQGVSIPIEALRRTPVGAQVFVAKPNASGQLRAEQRSVVVQQSIGGQAILYSGVQVGEQVVTTGSFKLLDGGLLQETSKPTHPASSRGVN